MYKSRITLPVTACLCILTTGCVSTVINAGFKGYDMNNDGFISFEEYSEDAETDSVYIEEAQEKGVTVLEHVRSEFDLLDGNGDGKLTKQEMKDNWRTMK